MISNTKGIKAHDPSPSINSKPAKPIPAWKICEGCGNELRIFFRNSDNAPFLGCANWKENAQCRKAQTPPHSSKEFEEFMKQSTLKKTQRVYYQKVRDTLKGTKCVVAQDIWSKPIFKASKKQLPGSERIAAGTPCIFQRMIDLNNNGAYPAPAAEYELANGEIFYCSAPGRTRNALVMFEDTWKKKVTSK